MSNRINSQIHYNVFTLLQQLDSGVMNHFAWLRDLHRAMICQEFDSDSPNLLHDAHCHCKFGRWYEANQPEGLLDSTLFREIGVLHKEMHDAAREMLQEQIDLQKVHPGVYTRFMDSAIHFKVAVRQFQANLIERVCVVDQLTGAWNRHVMYYKLGQEQERLNRNGGHCCFCMVDIDRFKDVNDTYGHQIGDMVLRRVAEILSASLRKYDTIFRYGGEEFLLCLPAADEPEASLLLERLRADIEETPIHVNGHAEPLRVTASFGVACLSSGRDIEEVIAEADHALMWAKSDGRNCVRIWADGL
ncbi:MAG: diguanylate cyclase [Gammaproteobacteria bacterium HGW-Gammaproteobacteria-1]|jgi:diguanylate cyclase (GGDEF)-like protein|nr:MAG: diguanylate cyclase [Gammaproteobacteria bacterium HGW-Gammaproteobacteria-1]